MPENRSPKSVTTSRNLTRIFSVTDWRKYQLSRIVKSPLMSDLEKVSAGFMLRTGDYDDAELVTLVLIRMCREHGRGSRWCNRTVRHA